MTLQTTQNPEETTQKTPSLTMSLEEARAVRWLRNNPRPLGELLDEGYLNEQRLQWAAEKAYDSTLKAAAAVLLRWLQSSTAAPTLPPQPAEAVQPVPAAPAIDAGISLERAQSTVWPFQPFKGQTMGALMDTHSLSFKELGYAIDAAWDERVRRAAMLFMAERLHQAVTEPVPPAGPLKVMAKGKSFSQAQELKWTFLEGIAIGAGIIICLWLTIEAITRFINTPPTLDSRLFTTPEGRIALALFIGLMGAVVWLTNKLENMPFKKIDRELDAARKGQEGEDRVVETMRQNLDGTWTLFRNITLPGRNRGDIDAVLVGPLGVWALEIKNYTGEYRNIGAQWEYKAGKQWKLLKKSPSQQAQDNASRLSNALRTEGLKWVTPVVVWANPEASPQVKTPMVPVWNFDNLPEELGNLSAHSAFDEPTRARITAKLTELCEPESTQDSQP